VKIQFAVSLNKNGFEIFERDHMDQLVSSPFKIGHWTCNKVFSRFLLRCNLAFCVLSVAQELIQWGPMHGDQGSLFHLPVVLGASLNDDFHSSET